MEQTTEKMKEEDGNLAFDLLQSFKTDLDEFGIRHPYLSEELMEIIEKQKYKRYYMPLICNLS